jgi:hypothetical protein
MRTGFDAGIMTLVGQAGPRLRPASGAGPLSAPFEPDELPLPDEAPPLLDELPEPDELPLPDELPVPDELPLPDELSLPASVGELSALVHAAAAPNAVTAAAKRSPVAPLVRAFGPKTNIMATTPPRSIASQ